MNQVSSNLLSRPGDLIIEDIILSVPTTGKPFEKSIKFLIYSVEIYEDVYSNSLSGSLVFGDSLGIINHFSLMGNETIKIIFYTPGQKDQPRNKIKLNMRVYKVIQSGITDKAKITSLELVSEEFLYNSTTKFSASFNNMSLSSMVEKIFERYVTTPMKTNYRYYNKNTKITVSPTEGEKKSVVFPWWSPFYAINWLANRSFTKLKNGKSAADYLFFQQLQGNYMFTSLSLLKSLPVSCSYRNTPANKQKETEMFDNINELTILSLHNKLQDISTGVYGSVLNVFDINKKQISGAIYDYTKQFNTTQHTDKYPMVSPNIDLYGDTTLSYRKVLGKNSNKFNNVEDNEEHEKYALLRQSSLNQINSIILQIKVPGDSRRRVGDMIELFITSPEDLNKKTTKNSEDVLLSGKYLITKINHSFFHGDYDLIMTICKDSYKTAVPDLKTEAPQ